MNIDNLLSRGSQVSQIALVVLAIFGYFYTVVPVYQKDLLSEQISEKELQLSKLEKELENYPDKVANLNSQINGLQSDVEQLENAKDHAASELAQIKLKRDELEKALHNVQVQKSSAELRLNKAYKNIYIEAFSYSASMEYVKRNNNIYEIIDGSRPKKELIGYFLTPYDAIMAVINDGGSKSMEALEIIPDQVKDDIHKEIKIKLSEHKYSLSTPLVDLESEFEKFSHNMRNAEVDPTPDDGFNAIQFQLKRDFAKFVNDAQRREMRRLSEFMNQF